MVNFRKIIKYISLLSVLCFCPNGFILGQTRELDIYDEWFCTDSSLQPERPYFLIRNYEDFCEFWNKTEFEGIAPYIDFNKYMIFVWAPGPTQKDASRVVFERLVYKEDCLLMLMDFAEEHKSYGRMKRPVKAAILPIFAKGDVFVFKKIKKAWQTYEWKPVFAIWDMQNERSRPFEYVMMDRQERPVYQLATGSFVEITLPRQEAVSQPVETQMTAASSNQSSNAARTAQQRPKAEESNAPISIGDAPPMEVDPEIKPETAPGMGEDPLFGSEFDITF